MEALETFDVRGLRVSIHYDETPDSPREWCNLGTIRTWHRRHNIGDGEASDAADAPDDPSDWAAYLDAAGAVYVPVFMYEHSGIALSTGAFACPWDSGQVGYVYVMPDALRKEYGPLEWASDANRERALSCLRGEVEALHQFLSGDVYGYNVERIPGCDRDDCDAPLEPCGNCDTDAEHLDSCWGFFGLDYARESATEAAQGCAEPDGAATEGGA